MKTYIVHFNVYPDFQKIRRRTVKARDRQEAIAKVSYNVPGSFYHFIASVKDDEVETVYKEMEGE